MTDLINRILLLLFFVCYFYQFLYLAVSLLPPRKRKTVSLAAEDPVPDVPPMRVAVLIAARNEEAVIGALLDSVRAQDYPAEYLSVFVGADSCTDGTAAAARAHGAVVYERNTVTDPASAGKCGKGYVLHFLIDTLHREYGKDAFDAYLILDADNLLEPDFLSRITKTCRQGYGAVTCYRNSKNYGDNWVSAGYALWFLREARYLNGARAALGSGCAVSGTGFLVTQHTLDVCGDGSWNWFLLTEDIEFTVLCTVKGIRIGYCPDAVLYDEQPTRFSQSWTQRLRWSRGYLQVFRVYGRSLIRGIFRRCKAGTEEERRENLRTRFSCYDMTMNILPAAVLSAAGLVNNLTAGILSFLHDDGGIGGVLLSAAGTFGGFLGTLFFLGAVTALTERKRIRASGGEIVLSVFTFPFFMATYLPICIASLFYDPGWKPIVHEKCMTAEELAAKKPVPRTESSPLGTTGVGRFHP